MINLVVIIRSIRRFKSFVSEELFSPNLEWTFRLENLLSHFAFALGIGCLVGRSVVQFSYVRYWERTGFTDDCYTQRIILIVTAPDVI